MCDRSFLPEGEADLDFSLDFASDLFAFALASAALSDPLDLLRPRLPLSLLLLLPFSLVAVFGRLTKTGTAPKALTCDAIACSCLLL